MFDDDDDDDVAVRWILKNLGDDLTEADIDDMIADVDTDGSGWVDYNGMRCLVKRPLLHDV